MCKSKTLEVFSSTVVARTAPSNHGFTVGHTSYAHGSTNGQNLYSVPREPHRLAQHTGPALAALHLDFGGQSPALGRVPPAALSEGDRGSGPCCCSARRTDTHCRPNRFAIDCTPLGEHQLQMLPKTSTGKMGQRRGWQGQDTGKMPHAQGQLAVSQPGDTASRASGPDGHADTHISPTSRRRLFSITHCQGTRTKGLGWADWGQRAGANRDTPARPAWRGCCPVPAEPGSARATAPQHSAGDGA